MINKSISSFQYNKINNKRDDDILVCVVLIMDFNTIIGSNVNIHKFECEWWRSF